jgi:hypothetical protein
MFRDQMPRPRPSARQQFLIGTGANAPVDRHRLAAHHRDGLFHSIDRSRRAAIGGLGPASAGSRAARRRLDVCHASPPTKLQKSKVLQFSIDAEKQGV